MLRMDLMIINIYGNVPNVVIKIVYQAQIFLRQTISIKMIMNEIF